MKKYWAIVDSDTIFYEGEHATYDDAYFTRINKQNEHNTVIVGEEKLRKLCDMLKAEVDYLDGE